MKKILVLILLAFTFAAKAQVTVTVSGGGSGGSGTVTNIATGLGLSGGPITTTGTLLVDTASASILSRQRAAATYYPLTGNPSGFLTAAVTSVATSNGLTGGTITGTGTISGINAAADGATKGVASFTAADFDATTGNISIDYTNGQAASGSVKGFLTSTDWNTFNGKGSGTVTSVAALTLGTTGTDLSSSVATGTTTPVITLNVPTASASNRGVLSAADWTTFNSKGSGTVTSVTGTTNRITSSGGTTPAIDISPSYIGQSSITTLGTIGTGVFQGTAIADAYISSASTWNAKAPTASPTFTGTVTIPTPFTLGATSVTTTGTQLNYLNAATGTTGTTNTNLVFSTSPTLTTPILGVASSTSESITGTGGAGFIELLNQSSAPSTPTTAGRMYFDNSNRLSWKGTNGFVRTFDGTANTADRIYVLPDLAGTVVLNDNTASLTNKTYNGNTLTAGTYTLTGAAGKTLTFNNSITFAGTDATTMTFPTTTATIARTDAAQTFTGIQTFTNVVSTSSFQSTATASNSNFLATGASGAGLSTTNSTAAYLTGGNSIQFRVGMRGSTSTVATAANDVFALAIGDNTYTEATSGTSALGGGLYVKTQTFTNGSGATTDFQNVYIGDAPIGATNNWSINAGASQFRSNLTLALGAKLLMVEGTGGMAGQTTLVSGTKAITITGLTTSSRALVQLVTPSGVTLTTSYQAVCTSNTLTIQANVAAGTINTADGSTMNYFIIN